jgi:dCMP deaminase
LVKQDKLERYDKLYMDLTDRVADMSFAERKKVGSIAVKNGNILAFGFNGTPSGFDNECEFKDYAEDGSFKLVTKEEVVHAEANMVAKAAREGVSLKDSTVYINIAPCCNCALLLIQSGVSKVVYKEMYRSEVGLKLLNSSKIPVEKLK